MKAIRWIQNVAAVAALVLALNLADGLEISLKDACAAGVLVVLVLAVVMLLERGWKEERRAE